jgi:hypothetical protein
MLAEIGFLILILGAVIGGNFVVFRSISSISKYKKTRNTSKNRFLTDPSRF